MATIQAQSRMSNQNPALKFSIATITQATQITAHVNKAFRSEPTGQTWLYDSQEQRIDILPLNATQDMIQSPDSLILVGTNPSTCPDLIIATCVLRKPCDPPAPHISDNTTAWLALLAVNPSYHKQGYGAAILAEAERYVRENWGARRLEMDYVNRRIELGEWYERCGYVVTGKRREFFYGEREKEVLASGLEMIVIGKDL